MKRRERWARRARRAATAVVALTLGTAVAGGGNDASNVRLVHNSERFAVVLALGGAARMLGDPECQALLDEFADASGRPLRAALHASRLDAPEYLEEVFFYDAPAGLCQGSALAVTVPGSRVVLVCGSRFVRQMERSSLHAEAILIHETLHSLGLAENPPSSDYITERVRARCE
jgi:hypothetical protein